MLLAQSDVDRPKFDKAIFTKAAKWIHDKEGFSAEMLDEPEPMAVVNETHRLFKDALDRGIADNVIPEAMSRKLNESLFVFSGFKTAQSLGEAASWLRQADGTVKPFNSFLQDVRKIDAKYNERYLRAEYEFAVGSSQMAASWAEVEASGDSYNLQYRTAKDERVRSSHQAMADITLPPSDPFWDNYYPPNGWGCRCTAVQVRKAKYETTDPDQAMQAGNHATEIRGKDGANRGAMFRFNPGKQGQIFPPKHPYYKVAEEDKEKIIKAINDRDIYDLKEQRHEVKEWAKENLVGKTIRNKDIEKPIGFTVTGIKEALNQPHKYVKAKNEAIKDIRGMIRKGEYLGYAPDAKGNDLNYHYIKTDVAGSESYVVIKESNNGSMNFYSIVDRITHKKKSD